MADDVPGYRVLEQVGQGGFSTVYRARQERLDRIVALKVLSVGAVDDAAMRRFTRECRITGRLTGHPHVVTVLDTGMTRSGAPFIAMEYFEHGSLTERLEREGPLPVPDVLRVGVKIASALAAVHEAGVLHRDVKPQNVLVSRYGEPALTDFGIALLTESLDATHTTAFTPQHAAPEVLNGGTLRPTSDVYALGSTMYQLLAGGPAFHTEPGAGLAPLILRIVSEPPPPIQRPDLSPEVFDAVCQAMAKDPDDRFPTAISYATHLRRLQLQLGFPVTELPLAGVSAVSPPPVPGSRGRTRPSGSQAAGASGGPGTADAGRGSEPGGPAGPRSASAAPASGPGAGAAAGSAFAAPGTAGSAAEREKAPGAGEEAFTGPQPSGSEEPTAPAGRLPGDEPPRRLSFPPPGGEPPPDTVPGPAAAPPAPGQPPRGVFEPVIPWTPDMNESGPNAFDSWGAANGNAGSGPGPAGNVGAFGAPPDAAPHGAGPSADGRTPGSAPAAPGSTPGVQGGGPGGPGSGTGPQGPAAGVPGSAPGAQAGGLGGPGGALSAPGRGAGTQGGPGGSGGAPGAPGDGAGPQGGSAGVLGRTPGMQGGGPGGPGGGTGPQGPVVGVPGSAPGVPGGPGGSGSALGVPGRGAGVPGGGAGPQGGPVDGGDGGRKSRKGTLVVSGVAVVAVGVAVGLGALLMSQDRETPQPPRGENTPAASESPRPTDSGKRTARGVTAAQIKLARPRAVRVKVINHGHAVVLRWKLSRAARRIPIFVHKAPGSRRPVPLKNGAHGTTIGHLNPKLGYCFQVFTLVKTGNPPTLAKAPPKCIRGAVPH